MSDSAATEQYAWLTSVEALDHNRLISRHLRQALTELDAYDVDIQKISDLLSHEPAMTGKLLMIANSPFYGFSREVRSIDEAVVVLGAVTLRALVNSSLILVDCHDEFHQRYIKHSLVTAGYVRRLSERLGSPPEVPFTAALFHLLPVILNYQTGIQHLLTNDVLHQATAGLLQKMHLPDDILRAVQALYHPAQPKPVGALLRLAFNLSVIRLGEPQSPFERLFDAENDFTVLGISPSDVADIYYDGWAESQELMEIVEGQHV